MHTLVIKNWLLRQGMHYKFAQGFFIPAASILDNAYLLLPYCVKKKAK